MKKRILCSLLALLTLLALTVCVFASEPQLYNVTDTAGLLTDEQNSQLEKHAAETAAKYGVGVYIVTVDDYRNVDEAGIYEATYGIYHTYAMGEGAERSGILLLLSMADRDFGLFRYGERAEYAFTEYGLKQLEESFLPQFGRDDWFGGFTGFLKACDLYLAQAAAGKPVQKSPFGAIGLVIAGSLVIAAVVVWILRGQMKSVRKAAAANTYLTGELKLTQNSDIFTHRTETRRKIDRNSSSGSSHAESGGGGAGRSGKF